MCFGEKKLKNKINIIVLWTDENMGQFKSLKSPLIYDG